MSGVEVTWLRKLVVIAASLCVTATLSAAGYVFVALERTAERSVRNQEQIQVVRELLRDQSQKIDKIYDLLRERR